MRSLTYWQKIFLAGLAFLILLYGAAWLIIAQQTKASLPNQLSSWESAGVVIGWRSHSVSGFPFSLSLNFDDLNMTLREDGLTVLAQKATLTLPFPFLWHRQESLIGQNILVTLADGRQIKSEKASLTSRGAPGSGENELRRIQFAATAISLPKTDLPLSRIDTINVEGEISGALLPPPTTENLAKWRDGGGIVDLGRISLVIDGLSLNGDATVTLDQDLRPLMAGTFTIKGLQPLLDQLSAQGAITPSSHLILKILAKNLEDPSGDVKLGLSIQNRWLYINGQKLTPLQFL